ncbi:hypothetical protein GTW43_02895, partial [Streptomyces sp. SID5785]|nr:hypothetical protein [Streptomyces sp. SID5785]
MGGATVDAAELARWYREGPGGAMPAYRRVQELVRRRIGDGHWREDDA